MKKVTVTLEDQQLEAIRGLLAARKADSVSGFVQHAVKVALADMAGWGVALGAALQQTGGPLSDKERAWADGILGVQRHTKRKRRAA